MTDNLLFYGTGMGIGALLSISFWQKEERSAWLTSAAILVPLLWTLILVAGRGTMDLSLLYDVREMNYSMPKNRATFWLMPMFASFLIFGVIWIEKNRMTRGSG